VDRWLGALPTEVVRPAYLVLIAAGAARGALARQIPAGLHLRWHVRASLSGRLAEDFRRIGGGIVLHDNGQRVLEALGLLESFRPHLQPFPVIAAELCGGGVLGTVDFGRFSPPLRHPPAVVLRHQLHEHLLAGARAAGVQVRFGHRVVSVSAAGDAAVLGFADGASERAGIVLACDGAGSAIRASLRLPARRRRLRRAYLRGVADIGWQQPRIRELWYPDGRLFGMAPLPGHRTYFWCTAPLGRWPQTQPRWRSDWPRAWPVSPRGTLRRSN
jgi:2-polyprenyl-6-methoxyphenol hydroxylase-like FAD-dependent oxidoreductase